MYHAYHPVKNAYTFQNPPFLPSNVRFFKAQYLFKDASMTFWIQISLWHKQFALDTLFKVLVNPRTRASVLELPLCHGVEHGAWKETWYQARFNVHHKKNHLKAQQCHAHTFSYQCSLLWLFHQWWNVNAWQIFLAQLFCVQVGRPPPIIF